MPESHTRLRHLFFHDPIVVITQGPNWPTGAMIRKTVDSILEAVDPATGKVVASQRFDDEFEPVGNSGLLWSRREAPDGKIVVDIFRVRINGIAQ